jgi:hypothetical protein
MCFSKSMMVKFFSIFLFDYATRALKLSESNASNFITIARKSKTFPELKLSIANGELTVSKARKITPVLTKENSAHWIGLAKTLPKPKLEREVARVAPQTMTSDRTKYVTDSRIELKFGVSEDVMEKFRRAQDLISIKTRKAASFEDTLREVFEFYLERQDPVVKAQKIHKKEPTESTKKKLVIGSNNSEQPTDANASVPGTHYIPARTRHRINLRDSGQCTHTDDSGQRRQSRRWIEIHHKIPVSFGRTHDPQNLQTLCHSHHRQQHLV